MMAAARWAIVTVVFDMDTVRRLGATYLATAQLGTHEAHVGQ